MCRILRTFRKSYPFGGHAATNRPKSTLKVLAFLGFWLTGYRCSGRQLRTPGLFWSHPAWDFRSPSPPIASSQHINDPECQPRDFRFRNLEFFKRKFLKFRLECAQIKQSVRVGGLWENIRCPLASIRQWNQSLSLMESISVSRNKPERILESMIWIFNLRWTQSRILANLFLSDWILSQRDPKSWKPTSRWL